MTANPPPPVPAKKPKPERIPRWKAGDVVTTKFTVKVRHPGSRGRRFLFLLPGTAWKVRAVEKNGRLEPSYELTCSVFEIVRKEFRLRG